MPTKRRQTASKNKRVGDKSAAASTQTLIRPADPFASMAAEPSTGPDLVGIALLPQLQKLLLRNASLRRSIASINNKTREEIVGEVLLRPRPVSTSRVAVEAAIRRVDIDNTAIEVVLASIRDVCESALASSNNTHPTSTVNKTDNL